MDSTRMQSQNNDELITHIEHIRGYDERYDEVLFVLKQKNSEEDNVTVYFGGDMQDFAENMNSNSESKKYIKWSLENIAILLHHKFQQSHVLIVRPSRYYRGIFSCYDNYVPSGDFGVPKFVDFYNALTHLKIILNNVSLFIKRKNKPKESKSKHLSDSSINLEKARITLIGFSKGCIVLNQLIREFHFLQTKEVPKEQLNILSRISDLYFLDGGHSGKENVWITERYLLLTLTKLNHIHIHVHVTPYQVKDKMRPWIGKEEKIFTEILIEYKANVTRQLHFHNQPASLNQHFELLNSFT
ncbi:hypothetical protein PGB90_001512 [Kerria lacca]